MNRYELIYIIDTGLDDSARKELIERFTQLIVTNGGQIEKVDETWGKRRLAYAIDYKTEGYYVLTTFEAPGDVPREVERNLEISESVIRYLTVKLEEKHSKVKPRPTRSGPAVPPPVYQPQGDDEAPAPKAEAVEAEVKAEAPKAQEAPEAPEAQEAPIAEVAQTQADQPEVAQEEAQPNSEDAPSAE